MATKLTFGYESYLINFIQWESRKIKAMYINSINRIIIEIIPANSVVQTDIFNKAIDVMTISAAMRFHMKV